MRVEGIPSKIQMQHKHDIDLNVDVNIKIDPETRKFIAVGVTVMSVLSAAEILRRILAD